MTQAVHWTTGLPPLWLLLAAPPKQRAQVAMSPECLHVSRPPQECQLCSLMALGGFQLGTNHLPHPGSVHKPCLGLAPQCVSGCICK